MTVQELIDAQALRVFYLDDPARPVTGGYCGDLLSWVMGKCQAGDVWLTIMSNVNVAAVAMLTDAACVVLTEGVEPDAGLLAAAKAKGVNLLGSEQGSFSLAKRI